MNDRQRNQTNRLIRVQGFCTEHAPQFAQTPTQPGDAMFATVRAALTTLISQITGTQGKQIAGTYSQASVDQAAEREELLELLRTVNRTAQAIAISRQDTGLMERFRMPSSNGDIVLANTGDAFAAAIAELGLVAEFNELGYAGNVAADLLAEAKAVRDAEQQQGGALGSQVGATASLPLLLRQGSNLVKTLDALIKNRFRNRAEILGAWKTASHVTALPVAREAPLPTPAA